MPSGAYRRNFSMRAGYGADGCAIEECHSYVVTSKLGLLEHMLHTCIQMVYYDINVHVYMY